MKEKVLKKITPSKKEEKKVKEIVRDVTKKINSEIKKQKVDADIFLGGSIAKDTWLPKSSDIDIFIRFKNQKNISDITEKLIKKFKYERIKGSRDYFNLNYKGFDIELVPVLKIKKPSEAKNITDISPLHVNWVKEKISKNKNLKNEIRIAKQFLKAQKCYGAESYIKGFSGHVTDILIYYYSSFDKFIKKAKQWKPKVFIDPEKHYSNKKEALEKMNQSKTYSPIILVDPIQPERNAAAALSKEKFKLLITSAKKYTKNPKASLFEEKRIILNDLKKKKDKLIVLEASPKKKRKDIAGAELLKRFQTIKRKLKENNFKIIESDWQWYPMENAMFWFYFPKKELSQTKKHLGPPLNSDKENIKRFNSKWKNAKKDKKRYYVIIKRKYTKPEQLIKKIKDVKITYSQL